MSIIWRVVSAIGDGLYSVGEDIAYGAQRTGQGLGMGKDGRSAEIGYEDRALVTLLYGIFKFGITDRENPLYKAISLTLERYYSHLPDKVLALLAKNAGLAGGYMAGRMFLGKKLAEAVAVRVSSAVAMTAGYKALATKLGVSAGASATGVGVVIGGLMIRGVFQRASLAAERLQRKNFILYNELYKKGDLQLLYFLVEEPLAKYIAVISAAERGDKLELERLIRSHFHRGH